MATGTGQYAGGWEVTKNKDGSFNVPGIGVVGGGKNPKADEDSGFAGGGWGQGAYDSGSGKFKGKSSVPVEMPLTPPVPAYTNPLVPTAFVDLIQLAVPEKPEYEPYKIKEFNPTVKDGPGEEYGWEWTKGVRSRDAWNQEQNLRANRAWQQYQDSLANWQNILNYNLNVTQEQQRRLENQYGQAGLIAPLSTADITPQIRRYSQDYNTAMAAGDVAGAQAAHNSALELARSAGWIKPGETVESVSSLPQMSLAATPTIAAQQAQAEAALNQQKWQASPEAQDWYLPLYKQQAEANIVNTLAPKSSSGGITPYQQYQISRNEQQDAADIYSEARKMANDDISNGSVPVGTFTFNQLVEAYVQGGMSEAQAQVAAESDPRNIVNYYVTQLTLQRYSSPNPR